jgi:hypothetical protein
MIDEKRILTNQIVIMTALQLLLETMFKGLIPGIIVTALRDACLETEAYLRAIS